MSSVALAKEEREIYTAHVVIIIILATYNAGAYTKPVTYHNHKHIGVVICPSVAVPTAFPMPTKKYACGGSNNFLHQKLSGHKKITPHSTIHIRTHKTYHN